MREIFLAIPNNSNTHVFLGGWGAEPPRGGGRAGVLENRILKIQASLTAHWHDKGADWRGLEKQKNRNQRGARAHTT